MDTRLEQLATRPVGRLLWTYSLPAVVGMLVMALYNVVDRIFIGQWVGADAIAGLTVTFPLMNLATAIGVLIGVGSCSRISIVLGAGDSDTASRILGNALSLTIVNGLVYIALFALFMDPLLEAFGASATTLPLARTYMLILLPGLLLTNIAFSLNNVMRASGYPGKAMYTNLIGAGMNMILAPLFLFGFGWGIRGAAIATDISMLITAFFVMAHFFNTKNELHFVRGTFRFDWPIIKSVLYIGMSPFLINVAGASVNAIINNSLLHYGGDNAIAAVVVFNRFVTVFIFIVIGICQGMQPILGYNYGSGRFNRLFKTLWWAVGSAVAVTSLGSAIGALMPESIARMFMQDPEQINCAVSCLRITTIAFWIVGFQVWPPTFPIHGHGRKIHLPVSYAPNHIHDFPFCTYCRLISVLTAYGPRSRSATSWQPWLPPPSSPSSSAG